MLDILHVVSSCFVIFIEHEVEVRDLFGLINSFKVALLRADTHGNNEQIRL